MGDMSPAGARVLVVGDANPDLVLSGDVVPRFGQAEQLLSGAALVLGGSAAITAAAFARLGRPVSLVAAVGKDEFGAQTGRLLTDAGISGDSLVQRADVPTGLTVVLSRGDDRAILTLPGAIPTLTAAEVTQAIECTPDLRHVHVAALFLQPSLALGLAPVLAELHRAGITTSLDTNDDPSAAWSGVDDLLPYLDVLLPNRREVIALGTSPDPRQAAQRLAEQGPLVVVKDGANGAFAVAASGESVDVAGLARAVVDSTGAGDTFDAAFVDAWLSGRPLGECVRRAVTAGALAVGAVGGTAGQPTQDEVTQ
jgi:ribokinase